MNSNPSHPDDHHILSHGLKLHYADWGSPEAPTLILLHGGRDNGRSWDDVAARFRDRFHVVAPDLRGHGDSDWSPDADYSLLAHVYDLSQLIRHLGSAPVAIIAHSLGAAVSLRYAALHPDSVEALVAIEGLRGVSERDEDLAGTVQARLRSWLDQRRERSGRTPRPYASIEEAEARMAERNRRLTPAQVRHLTEHAVTPNPQGWLGWKFDPMVWPPLPVDLSTAELHALWSSIACPTLLICGGESFAANPAEDGRVRHFRNAEVAAFPNAGHWVQHDELDGFVARVELFLASAEIRRDEGRNAAARP